MRSMRWGALLLALTACGEGKAIFNVDVLSFISGKGSDTLHYGPLPGPGSANADLPPVAVTMLGVAAAELDEVIVTVAAEVENATGAGSIRYEIYFGPDSTTVYQPAHRYTADTVVVSGADTVPLTPPPLTLVGDTLFAKDTVWVGVRAGITALAGPQLEGRVRMTRLDLRIVADVSSSP